MKKILRVLMIVSLVLSMFAISVSAEEVSTPENPIDIDEIQSMQVNFNKSISIEDIAGYTKMTVLVQGSCIKDIYSNNLWEYRDFSYTYSITYRANSSYNVTGISAISGNKRIEITVYTNVGSATGYTAP